MNKNNIIKHAKLAKFDSAAQCDLLYLQVVSQFDEARLLFLIKERGYAVTPFLLNLLLDYGQQNLIGEIVDEAANLSDEVYDWLCLYWGVNKTEDYFCSDYRKYEHSLMKRISDEGLQRNRLWRFLIRRGTYDLVPIEVLENIIGSSFEDVDGVEQFLLNRLLFDHYAPIVFRKGNKQNLIAVKGGPEYLLKYGGIKEAEIVLGIYEHFGRCAGDDSNNGFFIEKALEKINDKEKFQNFEMILLECKRPNLSVKFDSVNVAFLSRYPKKVNWDRLWQLNPTLHGYLYETAANNPKVNAAFLQSHSYTFFDKLKDWWREFRA